MAVCYSTTNLQGWFPYSGSPNIWLTTVSNARTTNLTSWSIYTGNQAAFYAGNSAVTFTASTISYAYVNHIIQAPAVMSKRTRRRMQAEQRRADAAYERLARADREQRAASQQRARTLLMRSLTRDQQRSLEERQYFELNVNGRCYRIRQGTHGNVRLIEGGREVRSFCAQPDGVPAEDAMLAQKLMLETDEAAFLRVANARIMTA